MLRFRQYLLEANIVLPISQENSNKINSMNSGSFFPALTPDNPSGIGITIVANPNGESSTRTSLGMGFDIAPHLTGTVQQFLNQYGDKQDNNAASKAYSEKLKVKFNLSPQDKVITWQNMNKAVSNHQTEELNKLLVKYNLKSSIDNPPRAWGDNEVDEYERWRDRQMQGWETLHPQPVWEEGMSQEEWQLLMQQWETERFEYQFGIESQYSWTFPGTNGGAIGSIPQRNPLPMPKPPPETSPKPPIVLPGMSPWLNHNIGDPERGFWNSDWWRGRQEA